MNWTGGRLQRHSKANANTQVRAQKDHFARARLRQTIKASALTPLHLSNTGATDQQEQSRPSPYSPGWNLAIDVDHSQKGRRRSKALDNVAYKKSAARCSSTLRPKKTVRSSHDFTPPRLNTLEHVKQSLLKQSDWLGLAGARPSKPDQRPAAASEQVGRRRRVTEEDRYRQKRSAGQRTIEHNFIQPFAQLDDDAAPRPAPSANWSIRIGSNIHRSQTNRSPHPLAQPASAVPESSSTEPMLLDIVEGSQISAMQVSSDYYLAESEDAFDATAGLLNGHEIPDQDGLIPFQDLRNFPSFDEVKRYSSSARQIVTTSSQPASTQLLQEATGSQIMPLQLTPSPFVHSRRIDDSGLFSSDDNHHGPVRIDSEPPVFVKHGVDIAMQDIDSAAAVANKSRATQQVRNSRPLDTASGSPRESLAASMNSSQGGSSLASASIQARRSNDFKDSPYRSTPSGGYPRPLYTIERQVQLDEGRNQHREHLSLDYNRNNMPVERNAQEYRRQGIKQGKHGNGKQILPLTYFTPKAKECSAQNPCDQSSHGQSNSNGKAHRRQGDENEAWMRDVFSTDFEKLQQRFSFAKVPTRRTAHVPPPLNRSFMDQRDGFTGSPDYLGWRNQSPQRSSELSFPKTIQTSANTVLNVPNELELARQHNVFIPSETDFLSQMSPMTGCLDDRIVNLSTYNNTANTVRGFMVPQHVAAKRTAADAFGDSSYGQYDTSSQLEVRAPQSSSPAPYRVPLHTLYQVLVRIHPQDQFQATHDDLEHVSKSSWKPAYTPVMGKNSRIDRALVSREHFKHPSRTYNQNAGTPLDYRPVVTTCSGQLNVDTRVEAPQSPHLTASSFLDHRVYSPAQSSGHRHSLTSRFANEDKNFDHHKQDRLATLATRHNPAPSAQREASSSRSTSLSTTTRKASGPVGNFYSNQSQHFIFKSPQRPSAQYAHSSRGAPQFKAPPSIPHPLH